MSGILVKTKRYIINLQDAVYLQNVLNKVLKKDIYSQDKPYTVRSLYFASMTDGDFFNTIYNEENEHNIRVIMYNNDKRNIKFEIKKQHNSSYEKAVLCIQETDVHELSKGNFSTLLYSKDSSAQKAYILMNSRCYRPKTIVEYDRVAYIGDTSDIRVTFDYNVRITESCLDLFKQDLILYSGIPSEKVILEIKYHDFIPTYLLDLFSRPDIQQTTIDKYCLNTCFNYSKIYK